MSKCECNHEEKYHAIKEKHELGTSHCTKVDKKGRCDCGEYNETN